MRDVFASDIRILLFRAAASSFTGSLAEKWRVEMGSAGDFRGKRRAAPRWRALEEHHH